jgi:Protein of unknown function (DUF3455)
MLGTAALAALLANAAPVQSQAPPPVPDPIRAPSGEKLVLLAHASGAQIYVCTQAADGKSQWMLKAPDAELRDAKGAVIIRHFAGPSWKHNDGSEVTAKAVAQVKSADPDSIPWVLLAATSHSGNGVLASVANIQRLQTHAGQPARRPPQ